MTLEKIDAFAATYRGSEEEAGHVVAAYTQFGGEWDQVVDNVMLAREEDRARFRAIVAAAVEAGSIEWLGDDATNLLGTTAASSGALKAAKGGAAADADAKKKAAAAKKRGDRAAKEAKEAEELLLEIQNKQQKRSAGAGGGDCGGEVGLAALIRSRNQERSAGFDSWVAGLESKYGAEGNKAKTKGKKQGK